jgi:hypothetical protein
VPEDRACGVNEDRELRSMRIRSDVRTMAEQRGAVTECRSCGVFMRTALTMSQGVEDQARALLRGVASAITAAPDADTGEQMFVMICGERAAAVPREGWLPQGRRVVRVVRDPGDGGLHPDVEP